MDVKQSEVHARAPNWFKRIGFLIAVLGLLLGSIRLFLPGDPFPTPGQDSLKSPVAVKTWDKDVLILVDGRRLPLPGLKELPLTNSEVLRLATKQGVETDPEGRVYGLVPVYSEWGSENWHPQFRVDLSRLLLYTNQGVPERSLSVDLRRCLAEAPTATEKGYEAKQFLSFRVWNDLIDQGRLFLPP